MSNETLNLFFGGSALLVSFLTFIVTIITLVFTVKNSKGYIYRKIEEKQDQIRRIDHAEVLRYGLNGKAPYIITPEDEKKDRLNDEIAELKKKL